MKKKQLKLILIVLFQPNLLTLVIWNTAIPQPRNVTFFLPLPAPTTTGSVQPTPALILIEGESCTLWVAPTCELAVSGIVHLPLGHFVSCSAICFSYGVIISTTKSVLSEPLRTV